MLLEKKIVRQFIKFCLVGAVNTLIDYSVYIGLTRGLGIYFLYANICSILVAMSFSFVFNKYWTFRNYHHDIKGQYLKFFAVNTVYFLLNNAIFYILVTYLLVFDLFAKIIAIIIGLSWNFMANRHWTFKHK